MSGKTLPAALLEMRKDNLKEFTILDVRVYGVAGVIKGKSISSMMASEPLQRRIGYQKIGNIVIARRTYRKYAFMEPRMDGPSCLLTGRDCQLSSRVYCAPKTSTFEHYCLELCEGIEDGPFINAEGKRKKSKWGTHGQRFKFFKIWNKRYGDQDVEDASKVPR